MYYGVPIAQGIALGLVNSRPDGVDPGRAEVEAMDPVLRSAVSGRACVPGRRPCTSMGETFSAQDA